MSAKRIFQSKSLIVLASLTLAVGLLALSLVLMGGSAQAHPADDGGAVAGIDSDLGGGGGPSWAPTGGPMSSGGQATALAVGHQVDITGSLLFPGVLYAAVGTPNGGRNTKIYKSTDDGDNWTELSAPSSGERLDALTVGYVYTPTDGGLFLPCILYTGGDWGFIYKSADSGDNWTTVFSGIAPETYGQSIQYLATGPLTSTIVYAGGIEWPHDTDDVQWGVVYRSTDGGANWTRVLTTPAFSSEGVFNVIAINPDDTDIVYAAGGENRLGDFALYAVIYKTEDGGDTWTQVYSNGHPWFTSLAVHPLTPTTVYAGSIPQWESGYVLRSTDSGVNWTKVFTGAGMALALDEPDTIYAVSQGGNVYTSAVGGDPGSWGPGSPGFGYSGPFVSDNGTLYAGEWSQGVMKSTNDGATWEERNDGIQTAVQPRDIDVDPQNLDKMFAAAGCSGGWMTTDGGKTWMEPSGTSGCMGAFAINPEDSNIVYGGRYDDGQGAVVRSEDGGLTFESVYTATFILPDGSGGDEAIYALAIALSMSSTVYAAGEDSPAEQPSYAVVLRTLDDGKNWTEVFTRSNAWVEALAINPADDDTVYAGGDDYSGSDCVGFVYRTTDGGDNWDLTLVTSDTVTSIVVDYQKPNVLYVTDRRYDVRKSTDGGDTWTLIRSNNPPFEEPSGNLLAIDPNVPSHVYLGGHSYIAETLDGGQTWSEWEDPINQGIPGMEPRALTVDTGTPTQTLYAGFSGVWYHNRQSPQPGTPVTVTAKASALSAQAGETVTIGSLVVDQHVNWVADGTVVTFTTSPEGSFASSTVTRTTADGYASATLTGVKAGTATITITSGIGMNTLTVDFTPFKIYLPIVLRNF